MAGRQRARAPKKERAQNLGIFEIPNFDEDMDEEIGDGESDLESELEAILSGKTGNKPIRDRPKKKVVAPLDIEKLTAECLKDEFSDDNSDDDENLMDPDLLKELQGLTHESQEEKEELFNEPIREIERNIPTPKSEKDSPLTPREKSPENILSLLDERLESYNHAMSAAKALGENSKVRRYARGIKSLEQLKKSALSGQKINNDDIPPAVSIPKATKASPVAESPQTAIVPSPSEVSKVPVEKTQDVSSRTQKELVAENVEDSNYLIILETRKKEYKVAAINAKRAGDKTAALEYMKNLKVLDSFIQKALSNNEEVHISMIPPSPHYKISPPDPSEKEHGETQTSSIEAAALSAASEPEDPTLFAAPPAPNSIIEGLEQRLEKFKTTGAEAEAEGNSSKVRRLKRIIKSYEKAINDYKMGRQIDISELPIPPGFAPLPLPAECSEESISSPKEPAIVVPSQNVQPQKTVTKVPAQNVHPQKSTTKAPAQNVQPRKPKVQRTNTLGDKQLEFLLERQRLFREAALASKQNGNIQEAKEFLRMSKGFDSMIEASRAGLPIDTSSIPTPPQLAISDSDFVVVDRFECTESSDYELFEILHKDLTKQIEICKTNKENFLKLGDVITSSKFEKLGVESQKELSIIFHLKKAGQPPPKFHYETRMFSVVECNADLGDDDLQVIVMCGINLPHKTGKPEDLDSYIKLQFPIPTDAPQKAKTAVVYNTNNPVFNEEFMFKINRKSRAMLRQFKRGFLKLDVYSKGGFLKSDSWLGAANIKLVDLESTCNIHNSFDLMDGRKIIGGKLECKVRIKNPLLVKEVKQIQEKWLVIGS